jgi:hypothetical protein
MPLGEISNASAFIGTTAGKGSQFVVATGSNVRSS